MGRFVWAVPAIVEATGFVVTVTATAYAAHKLSKLESSKYNPGWKHQERQYKKAKEELDKAQLNVQNSIKENYPDLDNFDSNDGSNFRSENKLITATLLILLLKENCSGDKSKYNTPQSGNNKDDVVIKPSDNRKNREQEDKALIEKLWEIIVNHWSY